MAINKHLIRTLSWILGALALIILTYRIYQSIHQQSFQDAVHVVFTTQHLLYLTLSIVLMPINWLIESYKWYLITQSVQKIPFKQAVMSVLVGLAYGHLLPARSSEFIGKLFFFSEENKKDITLLHFINAAFQMYITVLIGLLFIIFNLNIPYSYYITFFAIIVFVVLSIILIYSDKLNFLSKKYTTFRYRISPSLKLQLITWSALRYMVFILQFYFLFWIYDSSRSLDVHFISKLSIYFLLTSIIPMISIIEVFVRAAIGVIVFHGLGVNELQITFITTLIWIINLALPSIIGFLIWILKLKTTR